MKLHLPICLFAAVLACMAPLSAEFAYLADGVDAADLIHSERFYDNGKGLYWSYSGYQPIKGAAAVYKSAGWDAFGALESRLVHTSGVTTQTFSQLTDDGNTCGYQVPVNMIQYWQSYYGVFYKGSEELPYGFNYSREYLDDFGGTQSLELGMLFYDAWQNTGNNVLLTSLWYMKGETHRLMRDPASGGGGYFADYYEGYDTCRYYDDVNTLQELKTALLGSFALEEQSDGSYVCTEVGRLMYVGLSSPTVAGGHAITCYGFDLDDAGNVVSMKMANSDDMAYKLFTVYVKEQDGHICLYNDAACTDPWKYAGGSWYLNDLAHLITPDILKQMYAVYSAEETPLSWNGEGGAWSASAKFTTDALPTAATGWDVCIGSEAYHSYYAANRPVLFDDGAASGNVAVSGAITVPAMVLGNTELPYAFTGSASASIKAQQLSISGNGSASFKNVTLSTGETSFSNYTLSFGSGAVFKAEACTVGAGGTLELAGGKAKVTALTLGKGGTLAVTAEGSVITSSLTMGAGSEMYLVLSGQQTSAALFSVSGSLTLTGAVNIEIGGAASLVSGSTYMLCSVSSGSVDVSQLSTVYGDLSFSNKVLYLTYQALPSLAWSSGSGTWSSTRWQGAEQDTAHADVAFSGGRGTVTVSGAVNPHSLTLSGGSYTLNGSGASVAVDKAVLLLGSAALTANVPLSASRFELQGCSSLTLNPGVNQSLDYLAMEESARLTLSGRGLTYTLNAMGALGGGITVGSGAALQFRCASGGKLGGTLASADASAAVAFTNASASAPVIYRVGSSLAAFAGAVTVGSATDAQGTTLSIGFTPDKGSYTVLSGGTLELTESAKFSAEIAGTGTLRVSEGTQCEFLLSSHRPSYATTLALDAAGSVSVGNAFSVCQSAVARALTVSGELTVYAGSGTFNYGSVTLNGGNYTVCMPYVDGDSKDIIQNISALTVGTKGGTVCGRHEGAAYYGQYARTNINSLSGSGDLVLEGSHFMGLNYYNLASVGQAGYSGNISVCNTLDPTFIPNGSQVSLELASCTLPGAVALKSYSSNALCRITLGLKGDVALGGLDSDGHGSAYLYSGSISNLGADMTAVLPEKQVKAADHTLTVNTAGAHSFAGKVMGPLHLVKEGSGTQQFTGDMSAWKGSLSVKQGKMSFGGALTMSGKLTMSGGTLQAATLETSAGASFSGCSTLMADSVADSAGWAFALSRENADTPVLTLASLSGSAGLSLSSLHISYDAESLTNGTYKLLQYNADFGGALKGITLGGDCTATAIGTKGSSDVYFTTATVGGKTVYTLMLDVNAALSVPNRDTATTLTWLPATGVWQQESGHEEKPWSGSAANLNFLNGDTVIFNKAATVSIVGEVNPAEVQVKNDSGNVELGGSGRIIGGGSLSKSGAGQLTLSTANTYSGGTTLADGSLTIAHAHALGSGAVQMSGGTLVLSAYAVDNAIEASGGTIDGGTAYRGDLTVNGTVSLGSSSFTCGRLLLESGTLTANVSTAACSVTAAGGALNGALTLNGGTLALAETLRVSGALTLAADTVLDVSAYSCAGTYTLLSAGSISGAASLLSCAPVPGRAEYSLAQCGNDILLTVTSGAATHEWSAAKGVLSMGAAIGDEQMLAGDFLEIGSAAAITLSGELLPGGIAVTADKNVTFTADKKVAGSGIAGSASVTKSGAGMLTLNAGNTYSGGTVLNAGTIKATAADSFGSGSITVNGGTLDLGSKAVANAIVLAGAATIKGDAKYAGSVTVNGDATLLAKTSYKGMTAIGAGSSLTLAEKATMAGSIAVDGGVFTITAPKGLTLAKNTSLFLDKGGTVNGLLTVGAGSTLVWNDGIFATAAPTLNGGALNLGGDASLTITGSKAQVQFGDKAVSLPGKGIVQTADELCINSGTVTVNAMGNYSDAIIVNGGTLKLATGKTATYNTVIVSGDAAVANGTTHYGDIIVNGTLAKGTAIKLLSADRKVELNGSGTMLGSISGTGRVEVRGDVDITAGGKLSNTDILLTGTLTHTKGWTLAKGQTLTLNGGSVNGALNIGSGAVLAMNGHTLSAAPVLKGGTADFGGSCTLALTGSKGDISIENQDFSLLSKSYVKSNGALTVNGGTVTVNDFGGSKEDITVKGGTLKLSTGKLTSDNRIIVSGSAAVANGTTHYGDIIVNGTLAKGTAIKLLSNGQKVQLNGAGPLLGSISGAGTVEVNASIDASAATLTAANIVLNHGTYTNTKGIKLAKGQTLTLNGASLNFGTKGVLSTAAGSTLAINSNTSISGSLTLGGGELVFNGSALDVQGTLTLSKATTVTGSGIITYDTLKAAKNVDVEKLFGKGAVLDTVNGTLTFGDYLPMAAVAPASVEPELTAAAEAALSSDTATAATEPATTALAAAPQKQEAETVATPAPLSLPAVNPVADAFVQSDWAVLETARAFTGSIRNRSMGTLTQDARGAVWAAAVGSYARHGSEGLHSGSRVNIYGGSIGAEHAVGEHHSLGVALGSTHTMVERTAMSRLRQNATHFALYGNSRLNGKLSADWVAAIGAADMHGRVGTTTAEWEQNSGALNARLNYTERLNERTALRAYAGAEYAATDADRVGGYKTGSAQTLRGEAGVAVTHSRENAQFYAELGLVNDLLRNNPTVDCGSYRSHGATPGRTSLKASVGGSVQLNESWSANAAYSIESAADATQQSINVGVSRKF